MRRAASTVLWVGTAGSILLASWLQARYRSRVDLRVLVETKWAVLYTAVMLSSFLLLGLPGPFRSMWAAVRAASFSVGATTVSFSMISQVFGPWLLPRPVVLVGAPAFCFATALLSAKIFAHGWKRSEEMVFFVGTEANEVRLRRELERVTVAPASLVCFVDATAPNADRALQKLTSTSSPTLVVLDEAAQSNAALVECVSELHAAGARVRTLTGFYEEWLGKLPVSELARLNLLFDVRQLHGSGYRRTKRLIDLVAGALGSCLFVVVAPFVWILNLLGNRGALMFSQHRVGERGELFRIYKFRTMVQSENDAGEWTQVNDPRITRFGGVLRRSHLDELPQALNLLRGDISLVGPRPEQPHYVELLTKKLPHYTYRHSVKPGLTGWAQIRYPYGADEEDALEKLEYELYYLARQSLALDLRVIVRTLTHFFRGKGR